MELEVPIIIVDSLCQIHIPVTEKAASRVAKIRSQDGVATAAFFRVELDVGCLLGELGPSPLEAAYTVRVSCVSAQCFFLAYYQSKLRSSGQDVPPLSPRQESSRSLLSFQPPPFRWQ